MSYNLKCFADTKHANLIQFSVVTDEFEIVAVAMRGSKTSNLILKLSFFFLLSFSRFHFVSEILLNNLY